VPPPGEPIPQLRISSSSFVRLKTDINATDVRSLITPLLSRSLAIVSSSFARWRLLATRRSCRRQPSNQIRRCRRTRRQSECYSATSVAVNGSSASSSAAHDTTLLPLCGAKADSVRASAAAERRRRRCCCSGNGRRRFGRRRGQNDLAAACLDESIKRTRGLVGGR
jgi:hypothetical protein